MQKIAPYRNTLSKSEKLCSKREFEALIKEGSSVNAYPIKCIYLKHSGPADWAFPVKMAVSVPKRRFKRAVDRNLLKRRVRECYRKTKHPLYDQLGQKNSRMTLLFVFIGKEVADYQLVEKSISTILNRIIPEI